MPSEGDRPSAVSAVLRRPLEGTLPRMATTTMTTMTMMTRRTTALQVRRVPQLRGLPPPAPRCRPGSPRRPSG
eukprot:2090770-Alexandrium_andersonii.AAC.1